MSDTRTAVHWWYIRPSGPIEGLRDTTYPLQEYLDISVNSAATFCIGWVYKVSDGSWVGVVVTPRTIKFYPTEEAAVAAIMLRSS